MPQQLVNQHQKALLQQRDALRAELAALRQTQHALLLGLRAGAKLCEGLTFLQDRILQHHQQCDGDCGSGSEPGALLTQLAAQLVRQHEAVLLAQLACLPDSSSNDDSGGEDGTADAAAGAGRGSEQLMAGQLELVDAGLPTVSPPHDPLAYMRDAFSAQRQPGVASMTAEQLAGIYREVVTQGSMLLHSLDCQPVGERRQQLLQQLRQHWDRYFQACSHSALVDAGTREVQRSFMIDHTTMQPDVERACQHVSKVARLIEQLGLTQQQRELIAAGVRLCVRQIQRINAEHAQLRVLLQGPACGSGGSGGAAADEQQQQLAKLNRLLLKGVWMDQLGGAWVVGCLSWAQVTRIASASWPFSVRWLQVGRAAMSE